MQTTKIKLLLIGILSIVMPIGTLNFYDSVSAAEIDPNLDYVVTSDIPTLRLEKGEHRFVEVTVQNVSGATWDNQLVGLATTYTTGDLGKPSIWSGAGWTNDSWIAISNSENVLPGKKTTFQFELTAPEYSGRYKEAFVVAADELGPLNGEVIEFKIEVGKEISAQGVEGKRIEIFRSSQQSNLIEDGYIVATLDISSGKPGYTTPAGNYKVMNQIPEAYSAKYSLWMSNWMGLVSDTRGYEGYGLHSLAYWKTSKPIYPDGTIHNGRLYVGNRVYEDAIHLGQPMSHGCVRYGIEESAVLLEWAEVGTPVTVI